MKISTRIIVTADRPDGTTVTLDRTVITQVGGNPAFERNETAAAVQDAAAEFIDANALGGTRPL